MTSFTKTMIYLLIFLLSHSLIFAAEETDTSQSIQPRVVYVNEKSPITAGVLGGLGGFGLGNFYAENNQLGTIGLVSEIIGLGLLIGGWVSADDDGDGFLERTELKWDNLTSTEAGLFYSGLGLMLASRVFGAITGVHEANKYNERLYKKFRYESKLEPRIELTDKGQFVGLAYRF